MCGKAEESVKYVKWMQRVSPRGVQKMTWLVWNEDPLGNIKKAGDRSERKMVWA